MVPDGWKRTTIGEVCDFVNGNGFKSSEWTDQGLPIIRIQNLNGSVDFNYFSGEPNPRWLVSPGDILFAWAGSKGASFGAKRWLGPIGVLNQHIFKVTPKAHIYQSWLYEELRTVTEKIENQAHGFKATLLHVQKADITEQVINLPPYSEQEKIAKILCTWDQAIATTEKLLCNSQKKKKWLMQQLLTKRKRLPEHDGEWKTFTLGSLGKTFTGLTGKSKEDFGSGFCYIPYKNIFKNSAIDINSFDLVNIGDNENQTKVQFGDIFFTVSSETPEEVGMSSVLLHRIDQVYLNSFCFGLRLFNFETLTPEYARYLLRSDFMRKSISALAQGATRYNISKRRLMQLDVVLPPVNEQQKIAKVLLNADDEISNFQHQLEKLNLEKRALTQQLLTGKRRTKVEAA
ncbi:restriction endonuclease subunit S [Pseudomonas sp. NPDC089569]|uniref:restriction endonuclease subunit S n=1 Tax=Pseudomonas sp. NPDC089569 TaxID=3390722 RepID=UPI003CFD196B